MVPGTVVHSFITGSGLLLSLASCAATLSLMVVYWYTICHDYDTHTPALLPLFLASSRRRRRRVSSKPQQQRDAASFTASEDEDIFRYSGNSDIGDDASSFEHSGCEDVSGGESDDGVAETDLDAELRLALMSTPMDIPTHRASQCEVVLQPAGLSRQVVWQNTDCACLCCLS